MINDERCTLNYTDTHCIVENRKSITALSDVSMNAIEEKKKRKHSWNHQPSAAHTHTQINPFEPEKFWTKENQNGRETHTLIHIRRKTKNHACNKTISGKICVIFSAYMKTTENLVFLMNFVTPHQFLIRIELIEHCSSWAVMWFMLIEFGFTPKNMIKLNFPILLLSVKKVDAFTVIRTVNRS